jgi:hypothetical protein
MLAPVLLLEMGEFLEQKPRTRSLEPLYDLADVLVRPIADEHVHMVRRYLARDDVQFVLHCDLPQKIPNPRRYRARQHTLAVLGAPHQVDLEVVLCVTAEPISSHSATSSTLSFA